MMLPECSKGVQMNRLQNLGSVAAMVAALLGSGSLLIPAVSQAQVNIGIGVSIHIAPPVLPVYVQPPMPEVGYLWVPGYWAWTEDAGYYWVPGTWVAPPQPGYLWTPGYWGWNDGAYLWHAGYWGTQIGFYGGVNYGFGYGGTGYAGGHWQNGAFFYNNAVNNIPASIHVTNVYHETVIVNNVTVNRVSFNGGSNGIQARPTGQELAAERAPHLNPVAAQTHQEQLAHANPQLRASVNNGHPAIAATARPGEFKGPGVVAARETAARPGGNGAHAPAAPVARSNEQGQGAHTPQPLERNGGEHAAAPTAEHAPPAAAAASHTEQRPEAQPRPQPQAHPQVQAHPQQHAAAPQHQAKPEEKRPPEEKKPPTQRR
jgi:hypothetical protein